MDSLAALLKTYQQYGGLAFIATVFATPAAMRLAHRFGILDVPDQKLKPHARPIPYLGGTAICAGWVAALAAAVVWGRCEWQIVLPFVLGGVCMSGLGLIDDIRRVPPKIRLIVGALIVIGVLLATGAGFRLADSVVSGIDSMAREAGMRVPAPLVDVVAAIGVPLSLLAGVFVVLGACNSANLIDGLDGLCSGVTAIISLGFFLLASHLAVWGYSTRGDPVRLTLAVAMFGAALGFLPWNFNPARIFMGDAGSMLLGYNCGILILLFAERGNLRWVLGALMIFALPVFDTALAMLRRWRSGRSIFEGDRSHFYDQLMQRGLSVRQTVLVCYGLTVIYVGVGLLMTWVGSNGPVIRTRYAVFLYLGIVVVTFVLAWKAGLMQPEERHAAAADAVKQDTAPAPADRASRSDS